MFGVQSALRRKRPRLPSVPQKGAGFFLNQRTWVQFICPEPGHLSLRIHNLPGDCLAAWPREVEELEFFRGEWRAELEPALSVSQTEKGGAK